MFFAQSGFGQNPFGPYTGLFQAYFTSLDAMAQGMGPMKGMARTQLEVVGLMSRRAQAYMEIPSRLTRCRTPQDVFSEQMRFWQTAFQQYSESSHKIMQACAQMAAMPAYTGLNGASSGNGRARERDYITFTDPKDANGQGPQSARERRVA